MRFANFNLLYFSFLIVLFRARFNTFFSAPESTTKEEVPDSAVGGQFPDGKVDKQLHDNNLTDKPLQRQTIVEDTTVKSEVTVQSKTNVSLF